MRLNFSFSSSSIVLLLLSSNYKTKSFAPHTRKPPRRGAGGKGAEGQRGKGQGPYSPLSPVIDGVALCFPSRRASSERTLACAEVIVFCR